jgi:thiosulfate/3-mercaptopyruvate sulfurtransferase
LWLIVSEISPSMPPVVAFDDIGLYPDAVVADVRWYLDGRSGHDAYAAGHLPGAVFVDLDRDLAAHDLPAVEGRHPLPTPQAFALAMGAFGIGDDTTVIAYDDTGGMTAGRLVVMLRMLGREAALLDGGIAAFDGELMPGDGAVPEHLDFTPQAWPAHRIATTDETVAIAARSDGVVLDARAAPRFTGEVTAIDPRPGHIPGATNAPWSDVLDPTGRFKSADELREHFARLGVVDATEVVGSCGSGVSTCINIIAMERAGLPPARLYAASFSGYAADSNRDVELGPGR